MRWGCARSTFADRTGHRLTCTFGVEVLGRYSNHADQGQRLSRLADTPEGTQIPRTRTVRRVFHRLSADQATRLVEAYLAGASQRELARDFRIHPQTAAATLDRAGIARRDHGLHGARLEQARTLYRSGESLEAVGAQLSVNAETVRRYLTEAGEAIRHRPGWRY